MQQILDSHMKKTHWSFGEHHSLFFLQPIPPSRLGQGPRSLIALESVRVTEDHVVLTRLNGKCRALRA